VKKPLAAYALLLLWLLPPRLSAQDRNYALVVGISGYPNFPQAEKLKYADTDARKFHEFILSPQGGAFPPANVHLITDGEATHSRIQKEIEWLGGHSRIERAYIFFAGHAATDGRGLVYLMPWDGDPSFPMAEGLRTDQFLQNVKEIVTADALVMFIDACHAASAFSNGRRGPDKVDARILQEWGTEFAAPREEEVQMGFFAAASNESALEDDEYREGLFTYYLIRGLKGEADTDKDRKVSALELRVYLDEKVADRALSKFKVHQDPALSPGFFPDLILSILGTPDGASWKRELSKQQRTKQPRAIVTPSMTKTEEHAQTGFPSGTIAEETVKAVDKANHMRSALTAVIARKDTITFLVTWPKDNNSNVAFIEGLIGQSCRESPRQCWFTQEEGNPRNLDKPPIPASARPGITVHGADAYALASALGDWFITYSTSTVPPELNGYNEYHTKEMMWIEIGPGSPWNPTQTIPQQPASPVQVPQTQFEKLIQTNKTLTKGDRDRLAEALHDYSTFLDQGRDLYSKANAERGQIEQGRTSGSIAKDFAVHVNKLREMDASAWAYSKAFIQLREQWKYYPSQTGYIFGDNPDNLGPNVLINGDEAFAGYLENWGKISNKDEQSVLTLLAIQGNDFNDSLNRFIHWVQGCEQRLEETKQSIQ
jgi:hypothetical protein